MARAPFTVCAAIFGLSLTGCLDVGPPWYEDPDTPLDVYWIHGLSSDDSGYDGRRVGRGPAAFDAWGWPHEQFLVAYHGCDSMPDQVWADEHGSHEARLGGPDAHNGPCGGHDSNTPIEHVAYHVAWLLHDRATERERCVALVGFSMGALVVQSILADVASGVASMPDDLCVKHALSLGGPMHGADIAQLCGAVLGHVQCDQIAPGSDFLTDVLHIPHPDALGGTAHTNVISEADGFVAARHGFLDASDHVVSYRAGELIPHGGPGGYFERDPDASARATWRGPDGRWLVTDAADGPLRVAFDVFSGRPPAWGGGPNRVPGVDRVDPAAGPVELDNGTVRVEVECGDEPDGHGVFVDFAVDGTVVETDRDVAGFSPSYTFRFDAPGAYAATATCRDAYEDGASVAWSVTVVAPAGPGTS